jgi:hypothetical protein
MDNLGTITWRAQKQSQNDVQLPYGTNTVSIYKDSLVPSKSWRIYADWTPEKSDRPTLNGGKRIQIKEIRDSNKRTPFKDSNILKLAMAISDPMMVFHSLITC